MYNRVDPITSITQKVEQGAQLFGTLKQFMISARPSLPMLRGQLLYCERSVNKSSQY